MLALARYLPNSISMIVSEKPGNALEATEELLLIPVSTGPYHEPTSGLALQVEHKYPQAGAWLRKQLNGKELEAGAIKIYEFEERDIAAYALVFAGIHTPGKDGWRGAHEHVAKALKQMPERRIGRAARIATAGIPGTGFSGLKGNADINAIRSTLERSSREIFVYHRSFAGDREPIEPSAPLPAISEQV